MKLKFYLIPLGAILLSVIVAIVVRFSYTDAGDKVYNYSYVSGGELSDLFKQNKVTEPDDVVKQSEIVVEAIFNGERKITADTFYSKVKVLKVYKGNQEIKDEELNIIEPLSIFTDNKFVNATGTFIIPMQSGEKYILLLKHMNFDAKRQLNQFQKEEYYPVTRSAFGCYRLGKNQIKVMDKNKMYTINSLKGFSIFTYKEEVLKTYNKYKEQIFKLINF